MILRFRGSTCRSRSFGLCIMPGLGNTSSVKTLALIDYGSGNLRSVAKALETVGASVRLASAPEHLQDADALVVPGVGSFGDCAKNLQNTGLWAPIRSWAQAGRPYLGICLGYQLLFESSEESPDVAGLGLLPGYAKKFCDKDRKVPHMGWNTLTGARGPLFAGLEEASFYFVHSFYPVPADADVISSRCDYGESFAASISAGNIHGVQFHPEKSQAAGLGLLKNFVKSLESSSSVPTYASAASH